MSAAHTQRGYGGLVYLAFAMVLGVYFTFAAVQGDYGMFARVAIKAEAASLEAERDRLTAGSHPQALPAVHGCHVARCQPGREISFDPINTDAVWMV